MPISKADLYSLGISKVEINFSNDDKVQFFIIKASQQIRSNVVTYNYSALTVEDAFQRLLEKAMKFAAID